MPAEILTEDLLRISLTRLAGEVAKTHLKLKDLLTLHMVRATCGLPPDEERAKHFEELGLFLIDLGQLYLEEAQVLRQAPGEPDSS